jgi:hypothetical protein
MDPREICLDLLHQSGIAGPQLGAETFGESEVVRIVGSWQDKPPGNLDGTEVESGIGVELDRESEGHVDGLRDGIRAELAVSLVLIERVQNLEVDQGRSNEIPTLLIPLLPEGSNLFALGPEKKAYNQRSINADYRGSAHRAPLASYGLPPLRVAENPLRDLERLSPAVGQLDAANPDSRSLVFLLSVVCTRPEK